MDLYSIVGSLNPGVRVAYYTGMVPNKRPAIFADAYHLYESGTVNLFQRLLGRSAVTGLGTFQYIAERRRDNKK